MAKEYIEREAARELIEKIIDDDWEFQYADDRLGEIPAVDVVEVRHGVWMREKWVKDDSLQDGGWWISRCTSCLFPYNEETPFCPHCGAKMDMEAE